jgi:alpha-glucosidase
MVRHPRFDAVALSGEDASSLEREYEQHSLGQLIGSVDRKPVVGSVTRVEPSERGAVVRGANGYIEVLWAAADCLHIVESSNDDGYGERVSVIQPGIQPMVSPLTLEAGEVENGYRMVTGAAECVINKADGTLTIRLGDDAPAFVEARPATRRAGKSFEYSIKTTPDTLLAGFGARIQPLDLRGQRLQAYPSSESGVLAPVPFALLVSPDATCGIYWRSTARILLDARRTGEISVEVEDSRLEYFIAVGHSPVAVLARFASLFPPSLLPPIWGMGLHVGGEALENADHVVRVVRDFRSRGIPLAAVQLGSTLMDSARPLTVNAERFHDFSHLVDQLHDMGVQAVLEMHPAVQRDNGYPLFASGVSRGVFVSYADGSLVHGACSGRMSVFPDFLREDVRIWWSEQMRPLVRAGIDGVSIYNAGPDVDQTLDGTALPDTALHQVSGETLAHSAVRTCYAEHMAKACRVGLDKHRGALRPFVRTSGGSPDPSKPSFLTVETGRDWESLRIALRAILNASVSGFQLTGLEIDAGNGEFMARALQLGCMMPSLLLWTQQGGFGLPWNFGEDTESLCRDALNLRTRLRPYLYTWIALAREYGVPVLRPLWMQEPANTSIYDVEDEFLVGDHVLVAPVLKAGERERTVYLPDGLWYDYWTNKTMAGGTTHRVDAPLPRLPLFVRAGAVLNYSLVDEDGAGGLIRIYPGNSDSTSYDDPGEGFSYLHGDYRWVYYTCNWETNQCFVVNRRRTGGFFPSDKRLRIEVVGLSAAPEEVRLDRYGAPLWYFDQGILEIVADDETGRIEIWLNGSPTSPTRKRRAL